METISPAASSASDRYAVGLTGGIGSGKSAVAAQFEALGAAIVDTDVIAHRLTTPGGEAIDAIRSTFGAAYIAADGALDRPRMRALAFSDPAAKRQLEAILHPRIRSQCELAATQTRAPYIVFVVPLLVESGGWRDRVQRILVVDCPRSVQVARVIARSQLPRAQVDAILAQQASRGQRLAAADDVLVNVGPLELLSGRVARLHQAYCRAAGH